MIRNVRYRGCSVLLNTDTPLMSRRSTVISAVCDCPGGGALTNTTYDPNVPSSALGPNVPALSGPATNSQKPSKPLNAAFAGS